MTSTFCPVVLSALHVVALLLEHFLPPEEAATPISTIFVFALSKMYPVHTAKLLVKYKFPAET